MNFAYRTPPACYLRGTQRDLQSDPCPAHNRIMNILTKIVTPAFIAFNAHCWFAYAIVFTFPSSRIAWYVALAAAIKEFYVDKHFEVGQTFDDNLQDFLGYVTGIILAMLVHRFV